MGNTTKVGKNTYAALMELKGAGFYNLRCYQLENGAINVGGEKVTANGQVITDYRRLYTPKGGGGTRAANRAYQRIFTEYNWFKSKNKDVCQKPTTSPSSQRQDFAESQIMVAIISLVAMAVVAIVMVALGVAKP